MDDSVKELFNAMSTLYERITNFRKRVGSSGSETLDVSGDVLLRVVKQTVECSYFIQDYCMPSFSTSNVT